jgi:hypothetical protein
MGVYQQCAEDISISRIILTEDKCMPKAKRQQHSKRDKRRLAQEEERGHSRYGLTSAALANCNQGN